MQFPLLSEAFLQTIAKRIRSPRTGDQIDTFHHRYTVVLLVFFLIWVLVHLSREPILCYLPLEIINVGDWKRFIFDYCFVQGTYYVHMDDHMPQDTQGRSVIGYYQWVPVILALQAFAFYLPYFIWKSINWQSGFHLNSILAEARKANDFTKPVEREKALQKVAEYFQETLLQHREMGLMGSPLTKYKGRYLTFWYLLIKLMCLCNVLGQFFFLALCFGYNFPMWGAQVMNDLIHGRWWEESAMFPRTAYCDYPLRKMAKVQIETVQCLLKINLLNEKIFIFLWMWFLVLSVMSAFNFLYWLYITLTPYHRTKVLYRYLRVRKLVYNLSMEPTLKVFVTRDLRLDGSLLLYFISSQVGDLVAAQIAGYLWQNWNGQWRGQTPNGQWQNGQANGKTLSCSDMESPESPLTEKSSDLVDHKDLNGDVLPKSKKQQKSEAWHKKQSEMLAANLAANL